MATDIPIAGILNAFMGALMSALFALLENPFLFIGVIIFVIWFIIEEAIKKKHKEKKQDLSALLPYLMARR